jgi:hypothetical protein
VNRRTLAIIAAGLGVLALVAAVVVWREADNLGPIRWRRPRSTAFPSAAECASCHPDVVAEWQTSSHARSGDDPLIHASICGRCHTPVGVQLDAEYMFKVASGSPVEDLPASVTEGVTCVTCHAPSEHPAEQVLTFEAVWPNWRTSDLALRILPFDKALGPYGTRTADDPEPVPNTSHPSQADPKLTSAEFCKPCHDVVVDKGPLAAQAGGPQPLVHLLSTYGEWEAGPYPAQGKTCQTCHMARRANLVAGAVAPRGVTYDRPLPPRVRSDHTFAGADTAYWDEGPEVAQQERQAADRLRDAAAVTIGAPETVAPGATLTVTVTMRNIGAGHDLPTSFAFWREVWLEVVVRDAEGRELLTSGRLDDDGWLRDEYNPRVRQDPGLYDPYLVSLRARMVRSPANVAAWMQADRTVALPPETVKRNLNGTPILSWSEYNADPIVARVLGPDAVGPGRSSPLEEVYVLRYAEAIIKNGIPALATKAARFPVAVPAGTRGPLTVTARLLMRAMTLSMMSQQEEIADDPPIGPVYELGTARRTVAVAGR